jgi:hypothetical protein
MSADQTPPTLYMPDRHVGPPPTAWDPERVQQWLRRFAADALAARADGPWPLHPRDRSDAPELPGPFNCLYFGAFGVWLALVRLADCGYCELPTSRAEIFAQLLDDYTRSPDLGEVVPSWFLGDSALLTACCLTRPDRETEDRLAAVIRGNRANPTREALWGAPGTMIAALTMYEATANNRWAELYRDSVESLWSSWFHDETRDVWLWEQDLYGSRVRYIGAGHGWAGNLSPLWRGRDLLTAEQQAQLRERTLHGLARLAIVAGELANWAPDVASTAKMLVQWCHGAPGMITSLRHADLPELTPLLLAGARLTASAGPLGKGVSLCHGTDGNGMALLEIHRRTGDAAWLERAREFAMISLDQSEADRARYGHWRYSLWTGDAGLAWFLLDCLAGTTRGMPGLDVLW